MSEITLLSFFLLITKINILCASGPASMGMYQEEFVDTGLLTQKRFEEIMVMSSMTPGSDAIQMGLQTGKELFNMPGAIMGAVAALTPPIIILLLITAAMKFINPTFIKHFFNGVKPALVILLIMTAMKVMPRVWTMPSALINSVMIMAAIVALWVININATVVLITFGIIGVLLKVGA